jgi:GNAT superfamily N-acetyltransferase
MTDTTAVDSRLRRAKAGDAPRVRDLFCRSFADTFGHSYPPGQMERFFEESCPLARFEEECTGDDFAVFLAEGSDGWLLGHCTLGPYAIEPDTDRRWWMLRQLYLDPVAMGTGLGQRLLEQGIAEARARRFEELYLTVWIENHRARRFYERNGFVEVGRYAFVVGDQVDDDRILRLTL